MALANSIQLFKAHVKANVGKNGIKCPYCKTEYRNDNAGLLVTVILRHIFASHPNQADEYLDIHKVRMDVPFGEVTE
jgi:hypothetical protein